MSEFCVVVFYDVKGTELLLRRRAPVVQLDRASDFESECREFESLRAYQVKSYIMGR